MIEVQLCRGRAAFYAKDSVSFDSGSFDIAIYDLKTGKEILRCERDLSLPATSTFLLRKEQILIMEGEKLFKALF
jgi:hypothetical protein